MIKDIYDLNCFTPSYHDINTFLEEPPYGEGLWLLPSFMNHACWANTRRSFLGYPHLHTTNTLTYSG
jgi:hypothetical protein